MKSLILVLSLISASAFACPNINGHFKCKPTEPSESGLIGIQYSNGTYTVEDLKNPPALKFIADGKSHDMEGLQYSCTCSDKEVNCVATADKYYATISYGLTEKGELVRKGSTKQDLGGETPYEESYEQVCQSISK